MQNKYKMKFALQFARSRNAHQAIYGIIVKSNYN